MSQYKRFLINKCNYCHITENNENGNEKGQVKIKIKICSECKSVGYCCKEDQIKDWKKSHKFQCKKIQKNNSSSSSLLLKVPDEVIYEISNYFWKLETIVNLKKSCRMLCELFERKDHHGCENIVFVVKEDQIVKDSEAEKFEKMVNELKKMDIPESQKSIFEKMMGIENMPDRVKFIKRRAVESSKMKLPLRKLCYVKNLKVNKKLIFDNEMNKVLTYLPSLEKMDISGCHYLTSAIFDVVGSELKELNVSNVKSLKVDKKDIEKMKKIDNLFLGENTIKSFKKFFPVFGKQIKKLIYVHAISYVFSPAKVSVDWCKYLVNLEELDTHNCNISYCKVGKGDEKKPLEFNVNLRKLNISRIRSITDDFLEHQSMLEELKMNGVFKNVTNNFFRNLGNLRILYLKYSETLSSEAFYHTPNLEELYLTSAKKVLVPTADTLKFLDKLKILSVCCSNNVYKDGYTRRNCGCEKECTSFYVCSNCKCCHICKDDIANMKNHQVVICSSCNESSCKEHSFFCELCGKSYCNNCRTFDFEFPHCNCEFESLCSVCSSEMFFCCQKCKTMVCYACSNRCPICKSIVCWDCSNFSKFCKTCVPETDDDDDNW